MQFIIGCLLGVVSFFVISCSNEKVAGAGIDTSTIEFKVSGRFSEDLQGAWFIIRDSSGSVVDSVQMDDSGNLPILVEEEYAMELNSSSGSYFAYKLVPGDTILPGAPMRFWFPAYSHWSELNPPELIGYGVARWDSVRQLHVLDSVVPGRHLVRWSHSANVFEADLVISELASRFETPDSIPAIPAGSIRPRGCAFAPFEASEDQNAGLGCPHAESDAFSHEGESLGRLLEWSDTLIHASLVTATKPDDTDSVYSKLLLEFDEDASDYDLSEFTMLWLTMNLKEGDSLRVRLAQSDLRIGRWFYADIAGEGLSQYGVPISSLLLQSTEPPDSLNLQRIFGLELRNTVSQQVVDFKLYSLRFE